MHIYQRGLRPELEINFNLANRCWLEMIITVIVLKITKGTGSTVDGEIFSDYSRSPFSRPTRWRGVGYGTHCVNVWVP